MTIIRTLTTLLGDLVRVLIFIMTALAFAGFLIWLCAQFASAQGTVTNLHLAAAPPAIGAQAAVLPFDEHFSNIVDEMPDAVDFQASFTEAVAAVTSKTAETSVGEAPPSKKLRHSQHHQHHRLHKHA